MLDAEQALDQEAARANMEWRPVEMAPNLEISSCGDLRHRGGRRLRGYISCDGYIAYCFRLPSGKKIHRSAHYLVAVTFLGPPDPLRNQVAHNNGSRLDNRPENLRWASPLENQRDRQLHGTASVGTNNGRAKITDQDVRDIRIEYRKIKRRGSGRNVAELEVRYGLHRATIVSIAKGRSWKHLPMPSEALGM